MENLPAINFKPCPGFILIDPLETDKKSDYIAVQDNIDRPYKGTVLAIGDEKWEDGKYIPSPVEVGDFVLYSIAGIERFKMNYKDNPRYEFVIAPYGRILGIINEKE